jgi:hypothetical protein
MYKRKTVSFLYLINSKDYYHKDIEISIRSRGKVRFYRIPQFSKSGKRFLSLISKMDDISLISQYTGHKMTNTYVWGE